MGPEEKCAVLYGKYELGRVLGQGSFAKVYHARNVVTGENIAMKVVGKEKVIKVGMMEQIKRYVKGGELFEKVAKGKLREDNARGYFQQLISAIDFCHSRGVYHSLKRSDSSVRLQGQESGRKGKLGISADIFAVTPSFLVVEVRKACGDTLEYNQFCSKELRPALKDIVWKSAPENPTIA
ncbi:hypothetical protein MTR67_053610 [Solanum verrucosum]|uniref:Protein kinase domain-containing protein n=1 Tax=Solanum verrucosum TaxID=315347 RepID=A0AAF0V8Z5_SOLVR|nr:hypothetical protein MTR67_053610 [Solanum verrucosum]